MDRIEYGIKIEQISKLVSKKDYAGAAKVADTVAWTRVKKWSDISEAMKIYTKAGEYQKARNIGNDAYNRRLGGRRLLSDLAFLALKLNDIEEAEALYKEFVDMNPSDSDKYILLYKISKAKGEPVDKLITILEKYKENELEEKYEYELAELYSDAGRINDCVSECDDLILWFGDGEYVEKALYLKRRYAELTPSQQAVLATIEADKAKKVVVTDPTMPIDTDAINYDTETGQDEVTEDEPLEEEHFEVDPRTGATSLMSEESINSFKVPEKDYSVYDTQIFQAEMAENLKVLAEQDRATAETAILPDITKATGNERVVPDMSDTRIYDAIKAGVNRLNDSDIPEKPTAGDLPEKSVEAEPAAEPVIEVEPAAEPVDELRVVPEKELLDEEHLDVNAEDFGATKEIKINTHDWGRPVAVPAQPPVAEVPVMPELIRPETGSIFGEPIDEMEGQVNLIDWLQKEEQAAEAEPAVEAESFAESEEEDMPVVPTHQAGDTGKIDAYIASLASQMEKDATFEYDNDALEEEAALEGVISEIANEQTAEPEAEFANEQTAEPEAEIANEQTAEIAAGQDSESEAPETKAETEEETKTEQTSDIGSDAHSAFMEENEADGNTEEAKAYEVDSADAGISKDRLKYVKKYMHRPETKAEIEKVVLAKEGTMPSGNSKSGNIIIIGKKDINKSEFAIDLFKAISVGRSRDQLKVARTSALSINRNGLEESKSKIKGKTFIIEDASELDTKSAFTLNSIMEEDTDGMLVILVGEEYGIKRLMMKTPELASKFDYKIELKTYNAVELAQIAKEYAREQGYLIPEEIIGRLYLIINETDMSEFGCEVDKTKEIVNKAIAASLRKKHKKDGDYIILKEKDFKL